MSCRISAPPPGTELGDGSQSTRESPTEDLVSLYKSPAGLVLLTPILKIRESRQEVLSSHRWWVALLRSQTRPSWTQGPCVLHPAPLLQADPLCSGAGLGPSSSIRGVCPTRLPHPWDSPGKNTGVGSHSLLQGIFLIQGPRDPTCISCIAGGFFTI